MHRIAILYNEPVLSADHPDYASEAGVLESVGAFAAALAKTGHQVARVGIGQSIPNFIELLGSERPDVVVNFCEGFAGHSGGEAYVTGILELLRLTYTGSPPDCLGLVHDKVRTKQLLAAAGIPTASAWSIARNEDVVTAPAAAILRDELRHKRLFVKPAAEDASLGIDERSVVEDWASLLAKVTELQKQYGDVLVEHYLDGREFNVGIVALPEPRILPIAEIEFKTGPQFRWPIVSYHSKWSETSEAFHRTPVRCPASIDAATAARIEVIALAAFRGTGCRDYARVDLRSNAAGDLFVLEVNANPDAGPSAGLARALAAAGISYHDFALKVVETAAARCTANANSPARTGRVSDAPQTNLSWTNSEVFGNSPDRQVGDLRPIGFQEIRRTGTGGLRLRPLDACDKHVLLQILTACGMFRPDEIEVAAEILDEALRDGPAGHYNLLVAQSGETVVGWSCHGLVPLTDATYDLYWIAVHPDHQREGVGRALLEEIERSLEHIGGRWLLAETSSTPTYDKTRRFYEKTGFTVVGDVPDFYRSGDGRVTYGKRMTP